MKKVNYHLIESALGYLSISEVNNGRPLNLNPECEVSIKSEFSSHILTGTERWPNEKQEQLKLSLAYFLQKPEILDNNVLANVQDLTMPEPVDIRQFFSWLYEALFPDSPIECVDISNVIEDNDIMQVNF